MSFDIAALKRRTVARYPFFGSVAAGVEYEESERVRTTGSDGKTVYYSPSYLAGLSPGEQVFVLAHELCHIAFNHIRRSRGKDPIVWKKATDAVINQLLKRDGLEIPAGAVDHPEAIDYDAEQYYEILMKEKLTMDLVGGQIAGGQGPGGETGDGAQKRTGPSSSIDDDHSMWENAADKQEEEEQEQDREMMEKLRKILESAQEMDEDALQDMPDDQGGSEQESGGDELDEDAEYAVIGKTVSKAGNSEKPDVRPIEGIGSAGPIIDWRLLLRDTITYGVDWSFTHATLEDGIVRPALEERPMPETEIVLDTSWSVEEELLRNFLRECKNILQLSKVKAGCFDTVFYGFHDIRTEDDIEKMEFEGGGGTDFNVAVGAFTLRVDNRIIFTDGEADIPETPLNVIWVICGEKRIDPPGGTVIHITPEQLEKLRGKQRAL